jgi:type IV pilus assembly protein PilE
MKISIQPKTKHSGFSLIEIMVVVAIIGIISAIALPSYQEYVAKARRATAMTVILENAQFMERYFTQNGTYLNSGANPTLPVTEAPKDGNSKFYDITFSGTNTATSFTLQAAPKGAMASDACGTLTYTSAGAKGVSGGSKSASDCWR